MSLSIVTGNKLRALVCKGLLSVLPLLAFGPAFAADALPGPAAVPWRDSFTSRLEALALLQSLNADLLSHDSATLTL